jgi:hypothetical protein
MDQDLIYYNNIYKYIETRKFFSIIAGPRKMISPMLISIASALAVLFLSCQHGVKADIVVFVHGLYGFGPDELLGVGYVRLKLNRSFAKVPIYQLIKTNALIGLKYSGDFLRFLDHSRMYASRFYVANSRQAN